MMPCGVQYRHRVGEIHRVGRIAFAEFPAVIARYKRNMGVQRDGKTEHVL
jgi:hypothetical protein